MTLKFYKSHIAVTKPYYSLGTIGASINCLKYKDVFSSKGIKFLKAVI